MNLRQLVLVKLLALSTLAARVPQRGAAAPPSRSILHRAGFTPEVRPHLTSAKRFRIVSGVNDELGLLELRKQIGTQQQAGDLLGLTRRTVGTYEKYPERAPAWYRLALLGLLQQKRSPELAAPGSLTDPTL